MDTQQRTHSQCENRENEKKKSENEFHLVAEPKTISKANISIHFAHCSLYKQFELGCHKVYALIILRSFSRLLMMREKKTKKNTAKTCKVKLEHNWNFMIERMPLISSMAEIDKSCCFRGTFSNEM